MRTSEEHNRNITTLPRSVVDPRGIALCWSHLVLAYQNEHMAPNMSLMIQVWCNHANLIGTVTTEDVR